LTIIYFQTADDNGLEKYEETFHGLSDGIRERVEWAKTRDIPGLLFKIGKQE